MGRRMQTRAKLVTVAGCAVLALLSFWYIPDASYALLVGLSAIFLGLLIAASSVAAPIANVLLVAASTAFAFVLIELSCLFFRQTVVVDGNSGLMAKNAALGWVLRPGSHSVTKTANGRVIYKILYGIDEQGHRVMTPSVAGPAYAFLGDSFTFGEGVKDADTFPQSFSDLLDGKARVVNLGVSAYSPAQVLREMQLGLYDDSLKPSKVFFMLTAAWHMDRTACRVDFVEGAPRYVTINGKLVLDGACQKPTHTPLMTFLMRTATYRVLVAPRWTLIDHDDILTYIDIVTRATKLAQSKYGVPLKILYLRNPGYLHFTGFTDDEIMKRLRDGGADVFDITMPGEGKGSLAIAGDGHPSGAGNRLRAKLLFDHLRQTDPGLF